MFEELQEVLSSLLECPSGGSKSPKAGRAGSWKSLQVGGCTRRASALTQGASGAVESPSGQSVGQGVDSGAEWTQADTTAGCRAG